MLLEICKSVVSCFPLSSPFKSRHFYLFLLTRFVKPVFDFDVFSEAMNKARLKLIESINFSLALFVWFVHR